MISQTPRKLLATLGATIVGLTLTFLLIFGLKGARIAHAQGPECSVDDDGGPGVDFTTIQAAVDDINCLTISVTAGIYNENLVITRNLTLEGAGPEFVTIDGGGVDRVVEIVTGTTSISGFKFQGGEVQNLGGGIYNHGIVTLTNSIVYSNAAFNGVSSSWTSGGGGIANENQMVIENVVIENNKAITEKAGGGIWNAGAMTISNTLIRNNLAGERGGGIHNHGQLQIYNSLVISNTSLNSPSSEPAAGGINNHMGASLLLIATGIISNTAPNQAGGGIFNSGYMTITGGELVGNSTNHSGGGLYNAGNALLTQIQVSSNRAGVNAGGIVNIEHLTITYSTISENLSVDGAGGGVVNSESLWMENVGIYSNTAEDNGGGIYNAQRYLYISNSEIKGNRSIDSGGGGLSLRGVIFIRDSQISENQAIGGGGISSGSTSRLNIENCDIVQNNVSGAGGGISAFHDVILVITNSRILTNTAARQGGGIADGYSIVNISESLIANNQAGTNGGGLGSEQQSYITIQNSNFIDNFAVEDGGGIYTELSPLNLINSAVVHNRALGNGGGLYLSSYLAPFSAISNTTISSNTTHGSGGGVFYNGGGSESDLSLNNVTIVNNIADVDGDGIGDGGGLLRRYDVAYVSNSILALNEDRSPVDQSPDCLAFHPGWIVSLGYNLIGNGDGCNWVPATGDQIGSGAAPIDPLLNPLDYNGGDTLIHTLDLASPALDSGNPAVPGSGSGSCEMIDQHANVRPFDGDGGGAVCDIGSYEFSIDVPLSSVNLSGPGSGLAYEEQTLNAQAAPISATLPVRYVWQVTDHPTITHTGGLTDQIAFSWSQPGTKEIILTAENILGSVSDTLTITILEEPITDLAALNDSPTEWGSMTFLSATISAGTNVSYFWYLGDGGSVWGSLVSHTYPDVGMFTATVTATNSVSQLVTTTLVSITDVPILGLEVESNSPTLIGDPAIFTATTQAGTHVSYFWDLGEYGTFSGNPVAFIYPVVGIFTASVTATNSTGQMTGNVQVEIVDIPISGLAAASSSPTVLGEPTVFTATVLSGTNIRYHWAFGDGVVGEGAQISNTYLAAGLYTATVSAANSSNVLTDLVEISILIPEVSIYLPMILYEREAGLYYLSNSTGYKNERLILAAILSMIIGIAYQVISPRTDLIAGHWQMKWQAFQQNKRAHRKKSVK